ncbi:ARM repeat-containing protein [Basidiobolus meristosporus CBS 931.73]|uniref:ARM repeat-containing protein n=1 Tax=Basidiobolus meristosporus CBS 931.73 TaxID=1314790 RepID=A0A1Y1Z7A9_9FUNG|nr:ARM repeat-containing protein [Basidiobolus meristosporus CBS 931.73]|eukprot:ORY05994.1 ARM repeat-containing protein [Basidiobolus meristosporus CBS 931.73]
MEHRGGHGRRSRGGDYHDRKRHRGPPPSRLDEVEDIEKRLASLIIRVGDKATNTLQANLEALTGILERDFSKHSEGILKTILSCIAELPMKNAIYGALAGLLNAKSYDIGSAIVKACFEQLTKSLEQGEWLKAKLTVRFFGELVNANVILPTTLIILYDNLLSVLNEPSIKQDRADCFVWIVLSSLPWVARGICDRNPHDFMRVISVLDKYMQKRKETYDFSSLEVVSVYKEDVAYEQKEMLFVLWDQISALKDQDWEINTLVQPFTYFESILGGAQQHDLPVLEVPKEAPSMTYPLPRVVFQLYDGDYPSFAAAYTYPITRYLLHEIISETIHIYEVNRKECIKYLVNVQYAFNSDIFIQTPLQPADEEKPSEGDKMEEDKEGAWKCRLQEAIIEEIFAYIFRLPQPEYKQVYYTSLMSELCKAAPDTFPLSLGRATKTIYDRLNAMDLECVHRFYDWFAMHLSNFGFIWNWSDWSAQLQEDKASPKYVFIREALEKLIKLSYYERVKGTLPEDFLSMIPPAAPGIEFKYQTPGTDEDLNNLVSTLVQKLRAKASSDDIQEILNAYVPANASELDEKAVTSLKFDIVMQCVLMVGSKSFSHSLNVIERYLAILQKYAASAEDKITTIEIVASCWKHNTQFLGILLDKLLNYRIVDPTSIIAWVFGDLSKTADRAYKLEILQNTLNKVISRVDLVQVKVDSAKKDEATPEHIRSLESTLSVVYREQKEVFLAVFEKFVTVLTEKIVECESSGIEPASNWLYKWIAGLFIAVGRLTLFQYRKQISGSLVTIESIVFSEAVHPSILKLFEQVKRLITDRNKEMVYQLS